MLQALEARRLLSVTASYQDGVVTVMGTREADQIRVETGPLGGWSIKSGDDFVPVETGDEPVTGFLVLGGGRDDVISIYLDANEINVTVCGHSGNDTIDVDIYAAASVEVHGGYGDDTIHVDNATSAKPGLVDGMWGNDSITVWNGIGGSGLRVYGGHGDDVIRATSAQHAHNGHSVWGGTGNDTITLENVELSRPVTHMVRGGEGDDSITGSDGRDFLFGDEGNDLIRGGKGDDLLFGGPGNDRLYGHQGNDFFDGGPGRDRISGEEGDDIALEDPLDVIVGVEYLI